MNVTNFASPCERRDRVDRRVAAATSRKLTLISMSRDRPQTPGEALARTVAALMRRGKAFDDTVMKEPTGDSRRRGDVHSRGDSGLGRPGDRGAGGGGSLHFTDKNVDRFFLVGCSPYTFLQGTKSELLPPLTRDGYRLERDAQLKEEWDKLPQEEKDAYGFERETQDILQACVDAQDERQRAEEEALKLAGSDEHEDGLVVDGTSGFTFARNATAEEIEALQSTKHHAAWMGLREVLRHMVEQKLPQLGEERDGKIYGVKGGKVEGYPAERPARADAKQWETRRVEGGEARPEGERERSRSLPPHQEREERERGHERERERGDRGDRSDRSERGERDRERDRDRGRDLDRERDRDRERERDRPRHRERQRERSRSRSRDREIDRERERERREERSSRRSEKRSRRSPASSADGDASSDDSWLSDSANKHKHRGSRRKRRAARGAWQPVGPWLGRGPGCARGPTRRPTPSCLASRVREDVAQP